MTFMERFGLWVFSRLVRAGTISIELPHGATVSLGSGAPLAALRVRSYSALIPVLQTGLTGFAEAYMDGKVETDDLRQLFRWGVANQASWFEHPLARLTLPFRRLWQRIRPDRRHRRVRTMNDHYNLGNDFYAAWLDETMTYSSARFVTPGDTLEEAQRTKYQMMAQHAGLEPGMRLLEIGCGWGGFAEYAAGELNCDVVGVTLSEEQADYARKRVADAGLADRVDIRIQDFRDVEGTYDAVVSIEMIESIDERQWPALFDTISRCLRAGARAAMQVITIVDSEWERYRSRADFIQQYIFPGGQLPAPSVLRRLAESSNLSVSSVETFGIDYARTLAVWRERFESVWPQLRRDHDLDDRFERMWDLYLALCEAGFRTGRINVEQWVFTPNA